jgi:Holliday junction resolvase RusA-like endonuclease
MSERRVVQCVILRLPPPISANAIWRSVRGRNIKSQRYRDWELDAGIKLAVQNPGRIEGAYALTIKVPKKCRLDLDNVPKAISDLCQKHGVISNDRLCEKLLVERGVEEETVCMLVSTKGEQE